jgi:hypothetical protein
MTYHYPLSSAAKEAQTRADYDPADPFKTIIRVLDARIVERGGQSIFELKPRYTYQREKGYY